MKKIIISISLIFMIILMISDIAFPWNISNHKKMSEKAVGISQLPDYCENNLSFPFLSKQFQGPAHSEGKWGIEEFANDENKTATEWIQHGSGAEDEYFKGWLHFPHYQNDMRSVNHFYNPFWDNDYFYPYYNEDWSIQLGGLYDEITFPPFPPFTNMPTTVLSQGKPSVWWGYDGCPDSPPYSDFTRSDKNYFSWIMAKKYFYAALSGDSTEIDGIGGIEGKTNMKENERDRCFVLLFRSLGQLLHLVQDAGQPEHTRNDAHPLSGSLGGFENHATKYNCTITSCSSVIPWQSIVKSQNPFFDFFDSNSIYDPGSGTGIAEFSNYNFFTRDSIAQNIKGPEPQGDERYKYFTSPLIIEDQAVKEQGHLYDTYYYLSGPISDPFGIYPGNEYKLAKRRWYHILLVFYGWGDYTTEDPKIWDDYLDILIPKCIGYSAALLDYFFRGRMEIKNPFVNIGSGLTITGIEFEVKNITPPLEGEQTIEPFESGSLDLAYQYILEGQEEPVFHLMPDIYTITYVTDSINTQYVPLAVTFPAEGIIPAGARDLSFTLIFQGKLGNEEDAVAAQVHDFSGPGRIAFYFQPGGLGNESNIYTVLPDGSDVVPITNSSIPDSWYFSPAWSPDGTMLAFEKETCSDPDPDPYCDAEYYSRDIVVIDLTSDESYPNNVLTTLEFFDPVNPPYPSRVTLPSFSPDSGHIVALASDLALFYYALVVFDVSTGDWRYINDFDFWWRKDLTGSAPAWSPQGDKIAYYIHKKPDPVTDEMVLDQDIYLINPDGTGDIRLTDDDHLNTQPAWSPDGEWIVFVSDRDGGGSTDIWIMDRSGGNLQKICDCDPGCWSPTFSPDRSRIAFEQDGDIHTVNLSGSGLTQITTSGYITSSPAWSPFLPEASQP